MKLIKRFIEEDDFNSIMELIIRDSNQFHSICLDTYPPLFYLNEFSKNIIQIIEQLNRILDFKVKQIRF
jgi:diphosphomevalonate decarboxylase